MQCGQVGWSAVGQTVVASRPHELRGVEFGSIPRKVFDLHPRMPPEKVRDLSAAMNRALIP